MAISWIVRLSALIRASAMAALSLGAVCVVVTPARAAQTSPALAGYTAGPITNLPSGTYGDAVDVAVDAAGNSLVLWTTNVALYAQKFGNDGAALGPSILVSPSVTVYEGIGAALSLQSNGDFVAAWQRCIEAPDLSSYRCDIVARRFKADSTPKEDELAVYTDNGNGSYAVQIAGNDAGDFAVAWQQATGRARCCNPVYDDPIHVQRYSGATPQGASIAVTQEPGNLGRHSMAMAADGHFVMVFALSGAPGPASRYNQGDGQRHSERLVFQRFNADGTLLGLREPVSEELLSGGRLLEGNIGYLPPLEQFGPSYYYDVTVVPTIAMRPDGSFAIGWVETVSVQAAVTLGLGPYTITDRVFLQSYSPAGLPTSGRVLVDSGRLLLAPNNVLLGPGLDETGPSLAVDPSGRYLIAWGTEGRYSTSTAVQSAIFAQRYSALGLKIGAPLNAVFDEPDNHSVYEKVSIADDSADHLTLAWSARFQNIVQVRHFVPSP